MPLPLLALILTAVVAAAALSLWLVTQSSMGLTALPVLLIASLVFRAALR